jgi:hypothetical protein
VGEVGEREGDELRAQEVAMLAGTGDVRVEARAGCEGAVGMGDERGFQEVRIYKDWYESESWREGRKVAIEPETDAEVV